MSALEIFLIAVSVSIDAAAVSITAALCNHSGSRLRNAALVAVFFGGFQFIMPLIGFFAAASFQSIVAPIDHWLAFILLFFAGGKMIYETVVEKKQTQDDHDNSSSTPIKSDFFQPGTLVLTAVATSLDSLAVGGGLAFAEISIWLPAIAMGVVTAINSIAGILLGYQIRKLVNEHIMMIIGGSVIILIGVKILLEHLGFIP